MVLIERAEDPVAVQGEIDRITSAKLAAGVQIGNESVMLPIVCNSLLLPLAQTAGLAELTQRIDAFIGAQTRG
jgi:hypothetical protein